MKRHVFQLAIAVALCPGLGMAAAPQGSHASAPRTASSSGSAPVIENLYSSMPSTYASTLETSPLEDEFFPEEKENTKDPAYKTYKDGYSAILDERWDDARKKFSEVISNHPKSDYVDDASYWSCYALKNTDRKKAIKAYKDFIAKFPNSTYYDDAVADLSQLTEKHHSASGSSGVSVWSSDDESPEPSEVHTYSGTGKGSSYGYGFSVAPRMNMSMRMLNQKLRKLSLTDAHMAQVRMPRIPSVPRTLAPMAWSYSSSDNDTLDEKTKIKMDALYALGDTKEDSVSYRTLRDVALDQKQPRELRLTALDALSDFKKFDVLPDFIRVASTDKDEEVQNIAINYISDIGDSRDKNKRVDALIELYKTLPQNKKEQRETIFYTIADIGNDKAVDFLISVAKNSPDSELRRQAISYLGNIGGEKARAALYDILKEN